MPRPCLTCLGVVYFVAIAGLLSIELPTAFSQTPLAQPRPAIIVSGTVRDAVGKPIAGASVIFEEKGTSASIDAKTNADGTFSFLALRPGTYLVRAHKEGLREAVSGPLELTLGQKKQLDLVLSDATSKPTKQKSSASNNGAVKSTKP